MFEEFDCEFEFKFAFEFEFDCEFEFDFEFDESLFDLRFFDFCEDSDFLSVDLSEDLWA